MSDRIVPEDGIILALRCMSGQEEVFCFDCVYSGKGGAFACKKQCTEDALDLINRLKAEKEALINGQETLQKYIMELEKKGNTTMKEITAITTVEITEIAKVKDEVYEKYGNIENIKAEIEQQVKDIIYHAFDCDTVTVKHQIFVRDDVGADDDTDNN